MVDSNAEEDKSHQETVEQRPTALSMPDGNTLIPFGDMDPVLAHASKGSRLGTHEGL